MNINELSRRLKEAIDNAPEKERKITIIVFAIEFAEYIGQKADGHSIMKLLRKIDVTCNHDTEMRLGIALAKYVRLK